MLNFIIAFSDNLGWMYTHIDDYILEPGFAMIIIEAQSGIRDKHPLLHIYPIDSVFSCIFSPVRENSILICQLLHCGWAP